MIKHEEGVVNFIVCLRWQIDSFYPSGEIATGLCINLDRSTSQVSINPSTGIWQNTTWELLGTYVD